MKNLFSQNIYRSVVILMLCLLFMSGNKVSAMSVLQQADSAYNAQNYRSALALYNTVLDKQGSSSQLQYNLGNTHFRLGNTGRAVVAYERALRLDPSNENARVNLAFVNSTIKGLPEDGNTFLSNIHESVIAKASTNTWAISAFVLFIIVLGCAAMYLFSPGTTFRKIGFFGGLIFIVIFVYTFVIAWQTANAVNNHDTAIIIAQNAKLRSEPGTSKNKTDKTVAIPEGSKVEIIDSLSTPNDPVSTMWYNVALNNNTQAWIDASSVEQI